jgi:hypothetical protein
VQRIDRDQRGAGPSDRAGGSPDRRPHYRPSFVATDETWDSRNRHRTFLRTLDITALTLRAEIDDEPFALQLLHVSDIDSTSATLAPMTAPRSSRYKRTTPWR